MKNEGVWIHSQGTVCSIYIHCMQYIYIWHKILILKTIYKSNWPQTFEQCIFLKRQNKTKTSVKLNTAWSLFCNNGQLTVREASQHASLCFSMHDFSLDLKCQIIILLLNTVNRLTVVHLSEQFTCWFHPNVCLLTQELLIFDFPFLQYTSSLIVKHSIEVFSPQCSFAARGSHI